MTSRVMRNNRKILSNLSAVGRNLCIQKIMLSPDFPIFMPEVREQQRQEWLRVDDHDSHEQRCPLERQFRCLNGIEVPHTIKDQITVVWDDSFMTHQVESAVQFRRMKLSTS